MMLVVGSVVARDDAIAEALMLSREHVARSRLEPGCISHAVHIDADRPGRLVFVEQWQDQQALQDHFRVPASRAFAKALAQLSSEPPEMSVYDAAPVRL